MPVTSHAQAVRITIDGSLTGGEAVDLEVRPGTAVRDIVARWLAVDGAWEGGAWNGGAWDDGAVPLWCGASALDPDHRAGAWPLRAGARLASHPTRPCIAPRGLHAAAFAGPDAGLVIPLDSPATVGAAPASSASGTTWTVRDDAVDATHATLSPVPGGAVRVRDASTANGTEVWSRRRGRLVPRGRRGNALVRAGDVITVGRTYLEVRDGTETQAAALPRDEEASAPARSAPTRGARGLVGSATSALEALRRRRLPIMDARLDPTAARGWAGYVEISGPYAPDLTRAVILARGRRPPPPLPLDERWLEWLPPAIEGDGAVIMGASAAGAPKASACTTPPFPIGEPLLRLVAGATHTAIVTPGGTNVAPPIRVRADTADSLARARAGGGTDPPPQRLRWADAALLAAPEAAVAAHGRDPLGLAIVAGASHRDPSTRWEVRLDRDARHILVAGAPGTGKSTLLATLASAIAATSSPHDVGLVIVCAAEPGPLEPCLAMPQVRIALAKASPQDAMDALSRVGAPRDASPREATMASTTIVVVDDIHAFGADGRGVTQALERLAVDEGAGARVHLILATARPSAVLSPRLRAAMTTVVALRAGSEADSIESIGVARAAHLPPDERGAALVRAEGRLERVQVALPVADRTSAVTIWGGTEEPGAHLATAALRGLG